MQSPKQKPGAEETVMTVPHPTQGLGPPSSREPAWRPGSLRTTEKGRRLVILLHAAVFFIGGSFPVQRAWGSKLLKRVGVGAVQEERGHPVPVAGHWRNIYFDSVKGKRIHLKTPNLHFVTRSQMECSGETTTTTCQLCDLRPKVMDLVSSLPSAGLQTQQECETKPCHKTLRALQSHGTTPAGCLLTTTEDDDL